MANDEVGVPLFRMGIALSFPLLVALFAFHFKLNLEKKLLVSVFRTIVQLFLAGYVLLGFIFSMKQPILVIAYLLVMSLIAALETTTRQVKYSRCSLKCHDYFRFAPTRAISSTP